MAQAVSHRPLTAKARVSPCGICDTGTGFSLVLRIPPVNIIQPWFSILRYHLGDNNRPFGRSLETHERAYIVSLNNLMKIFAICLDKR
jgi:hypothetical protein